MEQIKDGFVFDTESKEVICSFLAGNEVYLGAGCEFFYGTKKQAITKGLIFNDDENTTKQIQLAN